MPVAGADLLAILHGIAAQGHSRAVTVAVFDLVLGKPALHFSYHFWFGEKLVRATFRVAL